jgi:hypothetical protein
MGLKSAVLAVDTNGESLDGIAEATRLKIDAFLSETRITGKDLAHMSITPVRGVEHIYGEGGAAGDHTVADSGLLITILYNGDSL